ATSLGTPVQPQAYAAPKKKKRTGLVVFLLVALVGLCLVSSAALALVYVFVFAGVDTTTLAQNVPSFPTASPPPPVPPVPPPTVRRGAPAPVVPPRVATGGTNAVAPPPVVPPPVVPPPVATGGTNDVAPPPPTPPTPPAPVMVHLTVSTVPSGAHLTMN